MAITIEYIGNTISVPQTELILISGTLYKLDTNDFHQKLRVIEASEEGIVFPSTHNHNTTLTLFGVTYARTIEILSPYSVTFTPDTQWSSRLDGSNNNIGDVEVGILNQNQVQVIPTNSAGLQDLSTLLASAYQGQVVINPAIGSSGTSTPIGTFFKPSNNMIDALTIAEENGLHSIILADSLVVNEDLSDGYSLIGTSPFNLVTVNSLADLSGASFENLSVQGELDGLNTLRSCSILEVSKVSGFMEKCAFTSIIRLSGDSFMAECYSNIPGSGHPDLYNSPGCKINVRDYHGSLGLNDVTDTVHSLEGYGGRLIIDSSCTGGTIHVRGEWFEVVDDSGVGCSVLDERPAYSGGSSVNPWEITMPSTATPNTYGYFLTKKLLTFTKWFGLK